LGIAAAIIASSSSGPVADTPGNSNPDVVYRAGRGSPSDFKPAPGPTSVWDSPTNPAAASTFTPGRMYVAIPTQYLPPGSLVASGDPGHYDIIGVSAVELSHLWRMPGGGRFMMP
jgi:hypothetical protein